MASPYRLLLALILALHLTPGRSQELRCNVMINSQKIQGANRTVFQTMQSAIHEFLNNTSWTQHVFSPNERIECNLTITLDEQIGSDEYRGTLHVQSRRPVFNSSYHTTLLNFLDENFQFRYMEFDKLEFNENAHTSNLTSVLAYYAFIILGYDYDSFSYLGGTEFFQRAQRIVNNAQSAPERGWRAHEGNRRNRFWLVENALNPKYRPLREAIYRYHLNGLDLMHEKTIEGRTVILEQLPAIQRVFREKPDPQMLALQLFFDAKSEELINILSEALPAERTRAVQILNEVDSRNSSKYNRLIAADTR